VLDSVLPPQHDYAALLRSVEPSFTTLYHGCAQASNCSHEFPHLQQVFDQAVAHLDTKPLRVKAGGGGEQLLTGYQLSQLLYAGLYLWQDLPLLPKMLYQIRQGNAAIASQILAQVQAKNRLVTWGMRQSVECSEEFAFDSQADITAAVQGLPSPLRADTLEHALNDMKICHIWHVRAVSRKEKQAVHSAIPTLILDGQYDPVTPPAYGQLVLKTLSHGFRYVFPGLAHGIRFAHSCPSSITWEFIDHPTRKPDASCISSLPSAFY
jgi:pimeloyl-ACP methyl ester carboxylesterase